MQRAEVQEEFERCGVANARLAQYAKKAQGEAKIIVAGVLVHHHRCWLYLCLVGDSHLMSGVWRWRHAAHP